MNPSSLSPVQTQRQEVQKISIYKNERLQSILRSKKTIQNVSRSQTDRQKSQHKSSLQDQSQRKSKKGIKNFLDKEQESQLGLSELDIETIVQIKEPNFYMEQSKKINIFKVFFSDEDDISPQSQLQKYRFQFNSIIERNYKFRIPFFRDLSIMARSILRGNGKGKWIVSDHVFSHQMTLNFKQLSFIDMINAASNRFSPQFLYKKFYADQRPSRDNQTDGLSEQSEDSIIPYRNNQKNALIIYKGKDEEGDEIDTYKRDNFRQSQINLGQDMKENIQELLRIGERKKYLQEFTIRDSTLHQHLSEDIKQVMRRIIYPNKKLQGDLQKTVRYRKNNCDRSGTIRLEYLKRMIEEKEYISRMQRHFGRVHLKTENLQ